jgi:uncharacterized membrane protein SirB2
VALIDHYHTVKQLHVATVATSVALFATRVVGVLAGHAWPMRRSLSVASVVIDTALLAAGATLWTMLQLNPMRDAWLGTKLVLLVVYVVLGGLALKRAKTRRVKAACFVAALACVGWMASVAVAHDPAGLWRLLQR